MSGAQILSLVMVGCVLLALPLGFPVGFTLIGVAMGIALLAKSLGLADISYLSSMPFRLMGLMENDLLQAMPLFIYFGIILDKTSLAANMLDTAARLFGRRAGGLGFATIGIGALIAPTTGAVGATVLTLGLLALPRLLDAGYDRRAAVGLVTTVGTYGTVLPPSIVLIILADLMRTARSEAMGLGSAVTSGPVQATELYRAMLVPVGLLVAAHGAMLLMRAILRPATVPPPTGHDQFPSFSEILLRLVLPAGFLAALLGSIITGLTQTVEAAALGALVVTFFAVFSGKLTWADYLACLQRTTKLVAMIFLLLIGASTFSLVFRGLNGQSLVYHAVSALPFGMEISCAIVFAAIFGLGFFLDALEILTLAMPIAMPPLLALGADPLWLAVLAALTIQTSFLTPPSGFALFFMRSVAPPSIKAMDIYRGVMPYVGLQLVVLTLVWALPWLTRLS